MIEHKYNYISQILTDNRLAISVIFDKILTAKQ